MKMNLTLDKLNAKRAKHFFSLYDFETIIGDTDSKHYLGIKKDPQTCRFCGKSYPEVSFKMDAHVIPQFMGNKHLLSYFECDDCNKRFSKYEDSFANFMGATRTISQIQGQGKNKVPKFKDMNTDFEIKLGERSLEVAFKEGSDEVIFDEANKELIIKTIRPSYIPIHIPKVILKIGISMLDEDDTVEYQSTINVINSDIDDDALEGNELFKVKGYFIPGPTKFPSPFAKLYTKKIEHQDRNIPSKHVVLYYGSYVYQMALPFRCYIRRV